MADGWKGVLGEDGKYYTDTTARLKANAVVENQRKISKELEKQNAQQQANNAESQRIAREMAQAQKESNEIEKQKLEEQKRMERQRIQEERQARYEQEQLEEEKHEHKKEMRLLKLFDEIALPYEVFKKFKKELFKFKLSDNDKQTIEKAVLSYDISEQEKEEYKILLPYILEYIESGDYDTQPYWMFTNKVRDLIKPSNKYNTTKEYKKLQAFMDDHNKFNELTVEDFKIFEDKEIQVLFEEIQKAKGNMILSVMTACITGFCIFTIKNMPFVSVMVWICFIVSILALLAYPADKNNKVKDLSYKLYQTFNGKGSDEQDKIDKAILHKSVKVNEEYTKLKVSYINKKLQELYDYRIHHYNMQIETIFYNSGLIAECEENELDFKTIDKDDIIGQGTIEDYFFYFNNYKDNNK